VARDLTVLNHSAFELTLTSPRSAPKGFPDGLRYARITPPEAQEDFGVSDIAGRALGDVRAEIASQIVQLQREYYGKGPTKARAYVVEDLVAVVLEETFTKAERTLVERGERDAIQQIRRRFQQQMADEFKAIVEQATGRSVRAFLSETNLEADVSVELFLLGDERTDMAGFEPT
jgi:uncharacterized protein YbcI